MQGLVTEPYAEYAQGIFAGFSKVSVTTSPSDVAEAVWRAANDTSEQLHFPAGPDAVALVNATQ